MARLEKLELRKMNHLTPFTPLSLKLAFTLSFSVGVLTEPVAKNAYNGSSASSDTLRIVKLA